MLVKDNILHDAISLEKLAVVAEGRNKLYFMQLL